MTRISALPPGYKLKVLLLFVTMRITRKMKTGPEVCSNHRRRDALRNDRRRRGVVLVCFVVCIVAASRHRCVVECLIIPTTTSAPPQRRRPPPPPPPTVLSSSMMWRYDHHRGSHAAMTTPWKRNRTRLWERRQDSSEYGGVGAVDGNNDDDDDDDDDDATNDGSLQSKNMTSSAGNTTIPQINDVDVVVENLPRPSQHDGDTTTTTTAAAVVSFRYQIQQACNDFWYGARFVHDQYLSILWRYSIVQSLAVTLPFAVVLWTSHWASLPSSSSVLGGAGAGTGWGSIVYQVHYVVLSLMLSVSSVVERLLQLPLHLMEMMLVATPGFINLLLEYIPNIVAVPLVHAMLWVQSAAMALQSQSSSLVASIMAVLIWRPAMEEWQYRSLLNRVFFAPRAVEQWLQKLYHSTGYALGNAGGAAVAASFKTRTTTTVKFIPLRTTNSNQEDDSSTNKQGQVADADTSWNESLKSAIIQNEKKPWLPLPSESMRILLGSILFASTRLCWLSHSDPTDLSASSPYGWSVGFLQSILRHFSTSATSLAEVRPSVRIWVLLLAIHQAVSTFLVAHRVFASLYRQRGLAASVGAHVAWTISKGTVPFRLLWRLYKWCWVKLGASFVWLVPSWQESRPLWSFDLRSGGTLRDRLLQLTPPHSISSSSEPTKPDSRDKRQ